MPELPRGYWGREQARIEPQVTERDLRGAHGQVGEEAKAVGFDGEDGKTYDRVSERLFRTLNQAIPIAANDSYRVG